MVARCPEVSRTRPPFDQSPSSPEVSQSRPTPRPPLCSSRQPSPSLRPETMARRNR
jgi:hypothetical protein